MGGAALIAAVVCVCVCVCVCGCDCVGEEGSVWVEHP